MRKKSQNPIAIRTRKWIINALLELLNEKSFREITIKEINIKADIARQTFYRHFKSKEEILEEYVQQLYEEFSEVINKLEQKTLYQLSLAYFSYWKSYMNFLNLLKKSGCEYAMFENYNKFMNESLDMIKNELNIQDEEDLEYAKAFIIGGFLFIKKQWMINGYVQSPEKLAELVTNLLVIK